MGSRTILELLDAGALKDVPMPRHTFVPGGDRYDYDFRRCRRADGWRQFDTDQDAWYYGVWYHPERHVIVTYAEGDEYITVCATDEEWRAEMKALADFHGAPPPAS